MLTDDELGRLPHPVTLWRWMDGAPGPTAVTVRLLTAQFVLFTPCEATAWRLRWKRADVLPLFGRNAAEAAELYLASIRRRIAESAENLERLRATVPQVGDFLRRRVRE